MISHEMYHVICHVTTLLAAQEDMKKIDRSRKKLSNARLDMDSARTR